jgi:H/ACA ribonucleoprotein complex subunit 4
MGTPGKEKKSKKSKTPSKSDGGSGAGGAGGGSGGGSGGAAASLLGARQLAGDFEIPAAAAGVPLETKDWPLLLKGYDRLNVLSAHFTPIPAGTAPLRRPIKE